MSKKILALITAALIIVAMIPFSAFAVNYLTAEGRITEIGDNYVTVNVHGRDIAYFMSDSVASSINLLDVGDKVRVLFDPAQPDTAVQLTLTAVAPRPLHENSRSSVTGAVTDATMNTITILTKNGDYRTFAKDEARIIASDGLLLGDTVRITFYSGNPQMAIEVRVTEKGPNHRGSRSQSISPYSATGTVTDATMNTITIIGQNSGAYRTFGKADDVTIIADDGISLGDVVRITYNKDDPTIAVKIEMVSEGDNH